MGTALIAGLLPLSVIVDLVNIGTLSSFIIVAIAVMVLRRSHPDVSPPFRKPFVPVVPLICTLFCLGLIVMLPHITILRFIVWMILGLIICIFFSFRYSLLGKKARAAALHDDSS